MHASTRINLVAFADGRFAHRKVKFAKQAASMRVFDKILVLNASMLHPPFLKQYRDFILSQRRGFGYWIWKPHIIEIALKQTSPGDLVVYLDVGFTLNPNGRARFLEYLEIALDSPSKMLSFQNVYTEYMWTKADLAHRLGVEASNHIMKTSQLSSGFIILGATPSNIDLIRQWQRISVEDRYRYSDDSPSVEPNHPSFVQHRHDQSISSLLRKLRGTAITHYEVQPYERWFATLRPKLPTWATRLRV